MIKPPRPENEAARLATLRDLDVLDTPPEERFDRITRLARRLFGVDIALVSLVDERRQWFKSRQGLDATETPRDVSFCGHAIAEEGVLVVPDAAADARFRDNPLVTEDPEIRFYAGCPLKAPNGEPLGTLCVIDREPQKPDEDDLAALCDLAAMVERELAALELATTDPLTGLSNRHGFAALARHSMAVSDRNETPLSLLFIDLDGFKSINDRLGHRAGDDALVEMAEILLEVFRESDVVARWGGDEFCVLLSGAAGAEVAPPVERLAEHIRARNASPDARFELRYSVGSVEWKAGNGETLTELIAKADRRMYAQKLDRRGPSAD